MKSKPMSAADARMWSHIYMDGARAALAAAEKSPPGSLQHELDMATARKLAGLALMLQIGAEK